MSIGIAIFIFSCYHCRKVSFMVLLPFNTLFNIIDKRVNSFKRLVSDFRCVRYGWLINRGNPGNGDNCQPGHVIPHG